MNYTSYSQLEKGIFFILQILQIMMSQKFLNKLKNN